MIFENDMQYVQFYEKYALWNWDIGRRETFEEAVDRTINHAREICGDRLSEDTFAELREGMLKTDAFPSMRLFQTAGREASRHPEAIFNCSYLPMVDLNSFVETMYLLGIGVGVGYTVERRFVEKLPTVYPVVDITSIFSFPPIVVEDSIEGWCDAFKMFLELSFAGVRCQIDYSKIRPSGAPLKTRGGVASGAEPLKKSIESITKILDNAAGRQLKPIEVHDIQCFIAAAIVSGGYRRSAMICLFDADDFEMLHCKDFNVIQSNKQRYFANNSVVIEGYKSLDWFFATFGPGFDEKTGEPGVVSRAAMIHTIPERRTFHPDFGVNPCGEIILRPFQFCNLSIANIRSTDSINEIINKVRLAAIWGTIMASVDNFTKYVRRDWRKNQIDERLLGVDLNGQRDNAMFNDPDIQADVFEVLKEVVNETNKEYAQKLGIKQAAASTCAKPAGNSATFFGTASGGHARFSEFYIRRMQLKDDSPMAVFLRMYDVPNSPTDGVAQTSSFDFLVKSPEGSVFIDDLSAIDQLNYWKNLKRFYTEHNPSVTISYNDNEVGEIITWMYENQNIISGLSFFPKSDAVYKNAPYEKIDGNLYMRLLLDYPVINWDVFPKVDYFMTTGGEREFSCVAGACEIV